MKNFFFYIIFLFISNISAQGLLPQVEVTIDPDTKIPDKTAPFDQSFILNIPIDSIYKKDDIKYASIFLAEKTNIKDTLINYSYEKKDTLVKYVSKQTRGEKDSVSYGFIIKRGEKKIIIETIYIKKNEFNNNKTAHIRIYPLIVSLDKNRLERKRKKTANFTPYTDKSGQAIGTMLTTRSYVETKKSTDILKVLVPQLIYNKDYLISIQYKPTREWVAKLYQVNKLLSDTNNKKNIDQAKKLYSELLKKIKDFNSDIETKTGIVYDSVIISFEDYYTYYKSKLLNKYKQLHLSLDGNSKIKNQYAHFFENLKKCDFCKALLNCNCHNQSISEEIGSLSSDILLLTCNLNKLDSISGPDLISHNKISLGDYFSKNDFVNVSNIEDIDTLQKNRNKKIQELNSLKLLLTKSSLIKYLDLKGCKEPLLEDIDNLLALLSGNNKVTEQQKKEITQVMDSIINIGIHTPIHKGFIFEQLNTVNSEIPDISTAAGNYIIPDFGLAFMNSYSNNSSIGNKINPSNFLIHPYYGFNFSIIPINKNVRLRDVKYKRFLHRISLNVGFTLLSLSKNRTDISDLLSGTSLLTGINIRPNRWLRFGSGITVYRHDDINPLLPQAIAVMPYVSFSIDIDVVSATKNLISLIK